MPQLGIIGCGTVTTNYYLPVIRRHFQVRNILLADNDSERCRATAARFSASASDTETIAQQCRHIIIATPPHTHYELLTQCVRKAKVVLCEKPFLLKETEAQHILQLTGETGCEVFAGHLRRFFPQVQLARQLVQEGLTGNLLEAEVHEGMRFNYGATSAYLTQTPTGGVLPDTGSHALDMLLHISGLEVPGRVSISMVQRDHAEPAHAFTARFTIGNDVPVLLQLSRYAPLANKITLRGTKATLDIPLGIRHFVRVHPAGSKSYLIKSENPIVFDVFDAFRLQYKAVFEEHHSALLGARQFVPLTRLLEHLMQHPG